MLKLCTKEDLEAMGRRLLRARQKINKTLILCVVQGVRYHGARKSSMQ